MVKLDRARRQRMGLDFAQKMLYEASGSGLVGQANIHGLRTRMYDSRTHCADNHSMLARLSSHFRFS